MRRAVSIWLLVLGLLATSVAVAEELAPDAPAVAVRAEKGKVALGEKFDVVVTATHEVAVKVELPVGLPLGDAFTELARTQDTAKLPNGLVQDTFTLSIAAFELGPLTFPALPVGYRVASGPAGAVPTEVFQVEVSSNLGSDNKDELKPLLPPVSVVTRDLRPLWIGGAAIGGLAVLLLLARVLRKTTVRRRAEQAVVAARDDRTPEEIALAKLAELAASGLLDDEDRRPVYFAASEIVREYLGRRYAFDALELTSSELLTALERSGGGPAARAEVAPWLDACDLVKYAKVPASRDEAAATLAQAGQIVERLRPVPVQLAPDSPPPDAGAPDEEVRRVG